jgi:hypothetical protein
VPTLRIVPIGVGVGIGIGIDSDGVLWLVLTHNRDRCPARIRYGMHSVRYASGFSCPNPILCSSIPIPIATPTPIMIPTAIGTGLSCIEICPNASSSAHPAHCSHRCRGRNRDRDRFRRCLVVGPHAQPRSMSGTHPVRYASYGMHSVRCASGFSYPNPILCPSIPIPIPTPTPTPIMIPTAVGTGLSCIEICPNASSSAHPAHCSHRCRGRNRDRDRFRRCLVVGPHAQPRSMSGTHPVRYAFGTLRIRFLVSKSHLCPSIPIPIATPTPIMIPTAIGTGLSCIEICPNASSSAHPAHCSHRCRGRNRDRDRFRRCLVVGPHAQPRSMYGTHPVRFAFGTLRIRFLVSKSYLMFFDSDSDSDPDPDYDPYRGRDGFVLY